MNNLKNQTILILEDDPEQLERLIMYLNEAGYDVVGAINLEEAEEALSEYEFDAALLDINIVGKQQLTGVGIVKSETAGIDFAQFLSKKQDIPMLFLSAHATNDNFRKISTKNIVPYAFLDKGSNFEQQAVEQVGMAIAARCNTHTIRSAYYQQFKNGKICIKTDNLYTYIRKEDIRYVRADGNAMHLYVKGKEEPYFLSTEMKKFFTQLSLHLSDEEMQCFRRVNNGYIVNFDYVTGFDGQLSLLFIEGQDEGIGINTDTERFLKDLLPPIKTRPRYKVAVIIGEDMQQHDFNAYLNPNTTPKYRVIEKQASAVNGMNDEFDLAIVDVSSGISTAEKLKEQNVPMIFICDADTANNLKDEIQSLAPFHIVLKAADNLESRLRFALELLIKRLYEDI